MLSLQDSVLENPALYSHEHVMAQKVAYKHLPPSMEMPHAPPPPTPTKKVLTPPSPVASTQED